MIDHFEIKSINFADCKIFYTTVLSPLNIEPKWSDESAIGFGLIREEKVRFLIEKNDQCTPSHIAFSASSQAAVEQFHQAGIDKGFSCNGKPGFRPDYASNYYAAFLLDPDGNNVEAVFYT